MDLTRKVTATSENPWICLAKSTQIHPNPIIFSHLVPFFQASWPHHSIGSATSVLLRRPARPAAVPHEPCRRGKRRNPWTAGAPRQSCRASAWGLVVEDKQHPKMANMDSTSGRKKKYIYTSSTAQGGGGSFKNRKSIGELGCCESRMAERSHWWIERWLMSPLFLSLSLSFSDYLSIYLAG